MTATATTITVDSLPVANSIDASNDRLLIYTASATDIQGINRNTLLGLSSQPMGISDSQTVSNKTLNNTNIVTLQDSNFTLQDNVDTTKQAQFQLSGNTTGTTRTYSLPNASVTLASLTGTETLTNKTLTAPIISGGSIDASTVTIDTLAGHTTSNSGSIYGIAVTTGVITGAGTVGSGANATNGVQAAALATNAITLGYAQITSNPTNLSSTSPTQVAGLTTTVTIPAGGRKIEVTAFIPYATAGAAQNIGISIWDGVVGSGTKISEQDYSVGSGGIAGFYVSGIVTPAAGSKTYNVAGAVSTNAATITAAATTPAYILVKAI